MRYDNKLFKKVTLEAKLKNDKNFNINIKNHNESRELNIFSDDAGNFLWSVIIYNNWYESINWWIAIF